MEGVKFNADGLVCAVVQSLESHEVLMLAWMNRQALDKTIETGQAHFYSRSRQEQWHKGATSGNTLAVKEIFYDCDGDCVLLKVIAAGPACHTGSVSCFFNQIKLKQS